MSQATVRISRASERDLKFRGIEILVDSEFVGNLQFGQDLTVAISPGHHRLTATNRLSTKSLEFDAAPGETVDFEVAGIALGGLWLLMAMLGTVAYRVTLMRRPAQSDVA
ncbi:MAG TPA: hypothetical protein VMI31_11445 [Fimbriimonadaceae bacterium]|nr:hypothetical protein [Fimbriimonadaceae bacterium]